MHGDKQPSVQVLELDDVAVAHCFAGFGRSTLQTLKDFRIARLLVRSSLNDNRHIVTILKMNET